MISCFYLDIDKSFDVTKGTYYRFEDIGLAFIARLKENPVSEVVVFYIVSDLFTGVPFSIFIIRLCRRC